MKSRNVCLMALTFIKTHGGRSLSVVAVISCLLTLTSRMKSTFLPCLPLSSPFFNQTSLLSSLSCPLGWHIWPQKVGVSSPLLRFLLSLPCFLDQRRPLPSKFTFRFLPSYSLSLLFPLLAFRAPCPTRGGPLWPAAVFTVNTDQC